MAKKMICDEITHDVLVVVVVGIVVDIFFFCKIILKTILHDL